MFVDRKYFKAAGGILGVLIALFTWSFPLAAEYLDSRFSYVEPDPVDLALDLAFGIAALVLTVVMTWVVHRITLNGVVLKDASGITGVRLVLTVLVMGFVAVVGSSWATVADALYPYAADVFDYGLLGGVMLVTMVPPFLTGWFVGLRAGDYVFTVDLREARAAD